MDVDQMVDDIFDQQFRKPRRNLRDIPKYKKDEYIGDEDFNSAYITPADITVPDLFPDEYNIVSKEKIIEYTGDSKTRGFYDPKDDEITVVEDAPNTSLLHEHFHKRQRNNYNANNRIVDQQENEFFNRLLEQKKLAPMPKKVNRIRNYISEKQIEKDINRLADNDIFKKLKVPKEERSAFVKNQVNKIKRNLRDDILYPAGYTKNQLITNDEPFANLSERWPEEIINPTTKTGKRLNRIWFE